MKLIFVSLLFLSITAHADLEFVGDTVQISQKYYSGATLIYDCARGSFICVDEDGVKDCEAERKAAKEKYLSNLACAVFKTFPSIKECTKYQQTKVNNPEGKKYCVHQEKKKGTTR